MAVLTGKDIILSNIAMGQQRKLMIAFGHKFCNKPPSRPNQLKKLKKSFFIFHPGFLSC